MKRLAQKMFATLALSALASAPAFAGGEGWTEDYAAAKQAAESEKKSMLIDFTGSDWCGWCIRLNKEVFSHDEFKDYAKENFVLVELDYPRNKDQSDELKAQNKELKETFGIRGFPTILLADEQGRPYAKTGYKKGGPEAYVEHLTELKQIRIDRDKHFTAAEKAKGVEKAKHLDAGLKVLDEQLAFKHYTDTIDMIIKLDSDNEAGLKNYYGAIRDEVKLKEELQAALQGAQADPAGTIKKIDGLLAKETLTTSIRQEALASKSQIQLFLIKDKTTAKATLLEAIAVDPDSQMGKALKGALERFFPAEDDAADKTTEEAAE